MAPRSWRSAASRGSAVARPRRRTALRVRTRASVPQPEPEYNPASRGDQASCRRRSAGRRGAAGRRSALPRTSAARGCFRRTSRSRSLARRLASIVALVAIDVGGIAGALYLALVLRELYYGERPVLWGLPWKAEAEWLPFLVLVTVLVFWRGGLYAPRESAPVPAASCRRFCS